MLQLTCKKLKVWLHKCPKTQFKTRLKIAKNKINNQTIIIKKCRKHLVLVEAFKLSTELVAAVAVGTIIGFILDNWFGTKPWLILIFFFVGVFSWNIQCN